MKQREECEGNNVGKAERDTNKKVHTIMVNEGDMNYFLSEQCLLAVMIKFDSC